MSTHPVLAIHPGVAAVAQDTAGCVLLHHRRWGRLSTGRFHDTLPAGGFVPTRTAPMRR